MTVPDGGRSTPASWINVVASGGFGCHVPAEGPGTVCAGSSRENMLTPRSNDPVTAAPGDANDLRDLDRGVLDPDRAADAGPVPHVARHGFGASRFGHSAQGIDARLEVFMPPEDPVRIAGITQRNTSARHRRIAVTTCAEWVSGTPRSATTAATSCQCWARSGGCRTRRGCAGRA